MEKHVILVGFMGAGKSTVGKLLAETIGVPFIDSDEWIADKEQATVSEVFATKGEAYFRQLEKAFLDQLAHEQPAVIAVGGGLPCFGDNMLKLKELGIVVYINTSLQTLTQRLKNDRQNRPLLAAVKDKELFRFAEDLISIRKVFYKMAHVIVPNESNKPKELVEKIQKERVKLSF
jgi:shikimate kinase